MSFPETSTAAKVRAAIAAMGQAFDLEVLKATYALFTPLQERAPKDGVTAVREIAYGEDPRQRLDLFGQGVAVARSRRRVVMRVAISAKTEASHATATNRNASRGRPTSMSQPNSTGTARAPQSMPE